MKKILLALVILGAGALAFARFNVVANRSRTSAAQSRAECARLASEANELTTAASDLRTNLAARKTQLAEASLPAPSAAATAGARPSAPAKTSRRATPADLRQRFGIAWNNSAEYILLSKAALNKTYLNGVDTNGVFTPTACAVLGLTPEERAPIEAAFQRVEADYAAWAQTAIQRVEPAGDVLADYRLPANPTLAHQIENEGMALLLGTIGAERGKLVHEYAASWITRHGNLGENGVRITVRRHTDGTQPPLWMQIAIQNGNTDSGGLAPANFPQQLRSLFPGGWRDVAQREGFTLPKDFDQPGG